MNDFKLFNLKGEIKEITGVDTSFDKERKLQVLVEQNMDTFFSVHFVKSEWVITSGRMDSVGLDENDSPVIFEYKKNSNDNVINQGLFYLNWLKDHKGDFKEIVREKLGNEKAEDIDWSNPCVICIANDFNKYDEYAVKQMKVNIKLIRYKKFDDIIAFERLFGSANSESDDDSATARRTYGQVDSSNNDFSKCAERLEGIPELKQLYENLCDTIESLGDLEKVELKKYLAYRKINNIICVEIKTSAKKLHVYLRVDINDAKIQKALSERNELRDVSNIGHYGTGDLELTVSSDEDIARNQDLLKMTYDYN